MTQALYELPEGWDFSKLGSIAKLVGGATPSKGEKKYWGGEIKWASVRDLNVDDLVNTEYRITDEGLDSCSSSIVPKGNLVIATRVGLGKVCRAKVDVAINQDLRGVIPNSGIEVDYLFYWFKQNAEYIESCGTGATVKGVKVDFIGALRVPLPPLDEQKRIVAKLDALFTRIDTAIAYLQETLKLSKALFASALDAAFNPCGDPKELPKEWEWKDLASVTEMSRRSIQPQRGRAYNYIGLKNIEGGTGRLVDYSPTQGGSIFSSKTEFSEGMVLYGKLRPYLNKVHVAQFSGIATTDIIPFKCLDEVFSGYLAAYMRSNHFLGAVMSNCSGARMPRATTKFFKSIAKIPLPPVEEQKHIAAHLDALAERTRALEAATEEKLRDLTGLKSSLLDAAFRGQL